MSNIDFLIDSSFPSYESFLKKIERETETIERFFYILNKWEMEKEQEEPSNPTHTIDTLKEWTQSSKYSYFPANCLYLYRWLISDGYDPSVENRIDILYRYLHEVGVTDSAVAQVKWGIVFCLREEPAFKLLEDFWEENILKRFVIDKKDTFTFSDLIDHFMVYHIGLKQLIDDKKVKEDRLSELQETILTGYVDIVNRFPELEATFGVTIERDMYRVYKLMTSDKKTGLIR